MDLEKYYTRENAYERISQFVEEAAEEKEPSVEVRLLQPKDELNFEEDFPEEIVDKLRQSSIHANIDHDAYQYDIGILWSILNVKDIKRFLKILLDNEEWFTVSYGELEVYFTEH